MKIWIFQDNWQLNEILLKRKISATLDARRNKGGSPLDDFYDDRLKNSPRDMRSIVHEIVERSSEKFDDFEKCWRGIQC